MAKRIVTEVRDDLDGSDATQTIRFALDGVEYYGGVGFLKAGLQAASAITTVSPTYAQEICTPAFGMGLDGLLNLRAGDLQGIVNGIDTNVWDPATDPHLMANYSSKSLKARKTRQKRVIRGPGKQGCMYHI